MDLPTLDNSLHQTSACAKFLLAGEYSVLNGGPALAIPLIDLRLSYQESNPPNASQDRVLLNDRELKDSDHLEKFWKLRNLMAPCQIETHVSIHTKIPIGKGLGSSAALCVAMARYLHPTANADEIAELALAGEKLFHGNPSGVDPYCVSTEQAIAYTRSPRQHNALEMQSLMESGQIFFLRDSGGRHSTKSLVESLMVHAPIIASLQSDAEQMHSAINFDADKIAGLMISIQNKLRDLGASSDAIEANIAELMELGASGAKITGSGRGGFVLSIFSPKAFAKLPSSVKQQGLSWSPPSQ